MPNFFIIGFPKCGTTALSEYLREHPQVFFSDPKEPHYFNTDFANREVISKKEYLRLFKNAKGYRAVGEGSVSYIYSHAAITNILKMNPEAKFIVMVRNPLQMIRSLHLQLLWEGNETEEDFETAWHLQKKREQGECIPKKCKWPEFFRYGDMASEGKYLERLYAAVPRERVLVIIFDDFVSDTRVVYKNVLRFLGCEPDSREHFPRVNERKCLRPGLVSQIPRLPLFGNRSVRRISKFFKRLFGLRAWPFMEWINRYSAVPAPADQPLSPVLEKELRDYFRKDVEKLSRLLDRDLTNWLEP